MHQRGQIFEDGSADILNGCPNCGWNKFLYVLSEPATEIETDAEDTDVKTQSDKVEEKKEMPPDWGIESIRILEKGSYELNLE